MDETDATVLLTERFCPRCGTRFPDGTPRCDQDAADLLPVGTGRDRAGRMLRNKYVLVRLLDEGSFGQVYRATHRMLKTDVAIKLLREERRDDPDAHKQFVKEARALMRLHTRHAVAVHDVDEAEDGALFLVMELLHGVNLDRYRVRGGADARLPWPEVVRFARHICEALEEAHEAGVIHRDLKPANVMIETARDGTPFAKVVDFGIVRLASPADLETKTTETGDKITGTPAYMSPEQCRGHTVDGRTDLYALGCILYELLTGETPFKSNTSQGMVVAHIVETPVSPTRAFPDLVIPGDLDRGIMALLEKDAHDRPQTAAEVGRWLDGLLERASRPRELPSGRARKWLWVAGGVLAAGLLAWAVAAMLAGGAAGPSAGPAGTTADAAVPAAASVPEPIPVVTGPSSPTPVPEPIPVGAEPTATPGPSEPSRGEPSGTPNPVESPPEGIASQEPAPAPATVPPTGDGPGASSPAPSTARAAPQPPPGDGKEPTPGSRDRARRRPVEPPAAPTAELPSTQEAPVPETRSPAASPAAPAREKAADAPAEADATTAGPSPAGSYKASPRPPGPVTTPDEATAGGGSGEGSVQEDAEKALGRLRRRSGDR